MEFEVVVEIPKGQRNKYEMDHRTGRIYLDRMLFTSTRYPADYGFVDGTLGLDGDPLDALVLVEEPTFPGCVVRARTIGMFRMTDEKGPDDKIIAVPARRPAPGAPAGSRPPSRVRPPRDPALLRGLQGSRTGQVSRGRDVGRTRRSRARDRAVPTALHAVPSLNWAGGVLSRTWAPVGHLRLLSGRDSQVHVPCLLHRIDQRASQKVVAGRRQMDAVRVADLLQRSPNQQVLGETAVLRREELRRREVRHASVPGRSSREDLVHCRGNAAGTVEPLPIGGSPTQMTWAPAVVASSMTSATRTA